MRRLSSILDRVSIFKKEENQEWATKPNEPADYNPDTDITCRMIVAAAQAFEQSVQSILYDGAGLSGEFHGFYSLLTLIEKDDSVTDIIGVCRSNGKGCLYVLEQQIAHPKFVELCNTVSLAGALMSVLRLLRMMEVKRVPISELSGLSDHPSASSAEPIKRTEAASERVCRVLGELCADPQTVDQIRSSLVKLFTLPLCPLPNSGVYLQAHSCGVIERLCATGLTSQIVWFLHDTQAMHQMVRQFGEMVGSDEDTEDVFGDSLGGGEGGVSGARDVDLNRVKDIRGLRAEKRSMWLVGARCIVALISAASLFTPVLTTDFVTAGGMPQFTYVLQYTVNERMTEMMTVLPRLFYCGDKTSVPATNDGSGDNVITFSATGEIFAGVLMKTVGLARPVQGDDTYDKFYRIASSLYRNRKEDGVRESYLQHLSYALLTTYSLSLRNCQILETAYQYLPTLTLALPSLVVPETVAAIVTLLSYVSQCIDNSASMSITAACASAAVIIDILFDSVARPLPAGVFEKLCTRLASLCAFFEMALRVSERHAKMTIRTGLFQKVFTEPFESLKQTLASNSAPMDEALVPVYAKLLDFGIALQFYSPLVATELKQCGLLQLCFDIICFNNVSIDVICNVMLLYKAVGCCDGVATNLEETLQLLMHCLQHPSFRCRYNKLIFVLTAVSDVLLNSGDSESRSSNKDQETLDLWHALCGFDSVLVVLISMHDAFLEADSAGCDSGNASMEEVFLCMKSAISTLSFAFSLQIADLATVSGSNRGKGLVPLNPASEDGDADGYALVVTSNQTGYNESDYHNSVKKLCYYHQRIAEAVLNSCVLSNENFSSRAIEVLCALIKGTSAAPMVQNPYAFGIALDLLRHLHCRGDDGSGSGQLALTQQLILQMLIKCVEGSSLNGQTLCNYKVSFQIVDNLVSFMKDCISADLGKDKEASSTGSQAYLIMLTVQVFRQYVSTADIMYILSHSVGSTGRRPLSSVDLASSSPGDSELFIRCNNHCSSYIKASIRPREYYYQHPWQSVCLGGASGPVMGGSSSVSTLAWDPVKYLTSLGEGSMHEDVPFISLGRNLAMQPPTGEKSKNPCAYLSGNLAADTPGGKIFCSSSSGGFSFGCWIRIPSPDVSKSFSAFDSRCPIIPLMSLSSISNGFSFLEVHYDHVMGMVQVLTCKTSGGFTINQFKTPYHLGNDTWNHFMISVKRPKRFAMTSFKSHVDVYFNGVQGAACDSDMIDIEYPVSTSTVNINIGYVHMCKVYDVSVVTGVVSVYDPAGDRWNRADMETVRADDMHCSIFNMWHLGPTVLFDDVLTQAQVSYMLLLGPSYTGAFKDACMPLYQSSIAQSSTMLSRFNLVEAPVDRALGLMGYAPEFLYIAPEEGATTCAVAADSVDDMAPQQSTATAGSAATTTGINAAALGTDVAAIALGSSFPNPVLLLNAVNSGMINVPVKMEKNLSGDFVPVSNMYYNGGVSSYVSTSFRAGHIKAKVIFNAALDQVEKSTGDQMSLDFMEHRYANGCFTPDSVSSAVFALGSPATLLPILHQASTEEDLCVGLKLIKHASHVHIAHMKFLAAHGYNCIAFLLSTKPPSVVRDDAFDFLFDLAVDSGHAYVVGTTAVETRLLVDIAAFRLLILNHQVWDIGRYSLANKFIQRLNLLLTDQRYEQINCKRLASVGTVRWLLMMVVSGANKCLHQNDAPPLGSGSRGRTASASSHGSVKKTADANGGAAESKKPTIGDKWHIHCCDKQDADANDIWDPFISQVIGALRRLMAHNVVRADVECITQCVIYTLGVNASSKFEDVDLVKSTTKAVTSSNKHSRSFSIDSATSYSERRPSTDGRPLPPLPSRPSSGLTGVTGSETGTPVALTSPCVDTSPCVETPLLRPMDMVRIHLLKFLIYLFDMNMSAWYDQMAQTDAKNTAANGSAGASPAGKLFTSVLSPGWFFVILESSKDAATISLTLRLLAMLMQANSAFLHEFSSREGFNIITAILTKQVQPLAVVLPLIGLLFRIPMSMLPQACQILDKEGSMLTKLLELEEFEGPDIDEPIRSELTIPMLSLILECYSCAARAKEAVKEATSASVAAAEEVTQNGVIIAVFKRAMLRSNGFRQLMQHRSAMELLATAMFNCSHANDEYGARILLESNHPDGLLSACKEEYITSKGAVKHYPVVDVKDAEPVSPSRQEKSANLNVLPSSEIILFEDGIQLTEILELIVHDAIYYVKNKMILVTSLLSFPQHASELFVRGFQTLIFNKIRLFLEMVLKVPSLSSFALLSSIFTLVIPLVKARVIDDDVVMEMLKFNVSSFEIISGGPISLLRDEERGQEKLLALLREFGTNARYLSIMCIYAGESQHISNKLSGLTTSDTDHVASRTAKLKYIRSKLTLLCVSSFSEDVTDWSFINSESTSHMVSNLIFGKSATEQIEESGVKPSGTIVLDAFHAPWVVGDDGPSTKKQIDSLWTLSTGEISKISQVFVPLVLQACLNLIMGDNSEVRCEALRMCACLVISRRQYTEQVLGNMALCPSQLAGNTATLDGKTPSTKSALGTRARLKKMIRGSTPTQMIRGSTPTLDNVPSVHAAPRSSIVVTETFGDFEDDSVDSSDETSSNGSNDDESDLIHPLAFKLAFIKLAPNDCTAYYAFLTDKDENEPVAKQYSVPTSPRGSPRNSAPGSADSSPQPTAGRLKINAVTRKVRNSSIGASGARGSAGSGTDDSFRESEEILFADFVHWIYDNEPKIQKILSALDSSLGAVIPSTAAVTEVIVKLQNAREPDVVKARDDLKSMINQTNEVRRYEESVRSGHLRRWMTLGSKDIMSGGYTWRLLWNQMQTMPLWGRVCQLSVADQVVALRPQDKAKAAGFGSGEAPVLEFNTNASNRNNVIILNHQKMDDELRSSDLKEAIAVVRSVVFSDDSAELAVLAKQQLAADAFREQNWRLMLGCGPEMMRRRMERNFSEIMDVSGMVASVSSAAVTPVVAVSPMSPNDGFARVDSHESLASARTPIPTSSSHDALPLSNKKMDMDGLRHNMEDFLKKIVKTGVIRKEASVAQDNADLVALHYDNEVEGDEEDGDGHTDTATESALNLMLTPVPPPRPTPVRGSSSTNIDVDTPATAGRAGLLRGYSEAAIAPDAASVTPPPAVAVDTPNAPVGAEIVVDLDMEPTEEEEEEDILDPDLSTTSGAGGAAVQHLTSTEEDSAATRANLLQEIVVGIVGRSEWQDGYAVNVSRLNGLAVDTSLLIITPKAVHLLKGFQVRVVVSKKGTQRMLEWTMSDDKKQFIDEQNEPTQWHRKNNSGQQQSTTVGGSRVSRDCFPTGSDKEESRLLEEVYQTLLSSDTAYSVIPLDEIFIIYRHRYQLKDTGLEIKDRHGNSFLFACGGADKGTSSYGAVGLAERILKKLIFELHLPNSIYHKYVSSAFTNFQLQAEGVVVGGYNRNFEHFYNHIMAQYLIQATKAWQKGEISNFEYLMHLNYSAGRSYHDLTQYPVFPWVLSDYSSDVLDLNNPKVFRDLSKPMGALGEKRLVQFVERYSTMEEFVKEEEQAARAAKLRMQAPAGDEEEEDDWDDFSGSTNTPPPFYYGTHYSCSGYVLYYLLRMQPYASAGIELQGGHFDVADRLFMSIESSWASASRENLQDVRELIPEFFCLPDFLQNSNGYEFGYTQKDDKVDNVVLPRWAHNDPIEFISKHREALESQYISEHLNEWIDLIFGSKQRGKEAVNSYNVFIHLTYPGEVDIDQIDDPVLRAATIAQIDNFGQTPIKLFQKAHPKRIVPDLYKSSNMVGSSSASIRAHGGDMASVGVRDRRLSAGAGLVSGPSGIDTKNLQRDTGVVLDPVSAQWHSHLQSPLCALGANSSQLVRVSYEQAQYPPNCGNMIDLGVGDMKVYNGRERIVSVPMNCCIIPPLYRKFIKLSQRNGTGLGIHSTHIVQRESTDVGHSSMYEMLHSKAITCVTASADGCYVVTGSLDMSVRLWKFEAQKANTGVSTGVASTLISSSSSAVASKDQVKELSLKHTLTGHFDSVTCLDICTSYQLIVSGGKDECAILWDLTTGRLVRVIAAHDNSLVSVSINRLSGRIVTLTRTCVCLHTANGVLLASSVIDHNTPMHNSEYACIFPATVGIAIPTSYWQDGVELVTGHEAGLVCLWKMKRSRRRLETAAGNESERCTPDSSPSARERTDSTSLSVKTDGSGLKPVPKRASDTYIHRELYVCSTISKLHEDKITALKLCCSANSFSSSSSAAVSVSGGAHGHGILNPTNMKHNKGSNISPQLVENIGSNSDLLVGDAGGSISRWSCSYEQHK